MAIKKSQARQVRQPVLAGDIEITGVLDGSTTTETIELSSVAEKVTVQSSGDLAGNIQVSANGSTFQSSTAFVANTMVTFSTHLVKVILVTRTSGSGKLSILAR